LNELPLEVFQTAIQERFGCSPVFSGMQTRVIEQFDGAVVWDGMVLIFDLKGHPTASRCYAWSVEGRVTAVLHTPPVDSPRAAVRAAIVSEYRK
jgi:hypothetical protein